MGEEVREKEVVSLAIARMTNGDSGLRRGLPGVGSGAPTAPCTAPGAGTCLGPSPGVGAILKAALRRPCPLLGLGYPGVLDSPSAIPGSRPKMKCGFMCGPSEALSLTSSEPASAPDQPDEDGRAMQDQKEQLGWWWWGLGPSEGNSGWASHHLSQAGFIPLFPQLCFLFPVVLALGTWMAASLGT